MSMAVDFAVTGTITYVPGEEAPSSALPATVAGMYWPYWSTRRIASTPSELNALWLAFAIQDTGEATGWLTFGLSTLDQGQFEDDLQVWRAEGKSAILSVGGAGETVAITDSTSEDNCYDSLVALIDSLGGVDGIDWDVEHSINGTHVFNVLSRLRVHYGSDWATSLSFSGINTQYKDLAEDLEIAGVLTMANIQYYDYSETDQASRRAGVVSRSAELEGTYGIASNHIGTGVKVTGLDPDTIWTHASVNTSWGQMRGIYADYRGVVCWDAEEGYTDDSDGFATTCAPVILA